MNTTSFDTFEMFVAALKMGIENPVQFAISKTGKKMTFADMSADDLVLEADGGFYIAIKGIALTAGSIFMVGFINYVLVELCQDESGVAVWYVEVAESVEAPETFSIPEVANV